MDIESSIKLKRIDAICNEVYAFMDKKSIKTALKVEKSAVRIDIIQEIIQDAVLESSLCVYTSKPYWFSGRIYEECSWNEIRVMVRMLMKKMGVPNGDYNRINQVINVVNDIINIKELVTDFSIMVFNNCVYDIKTGEHHDFSPKFKSVTCVPYNYEPRSKPEMWKQFLNRVLPDKDAQRVLQEFLGAIFINRGKDAQFEHMMILLGSGGNGKSVICDTITAMLGQENVTSYGLGSLIGGGERLKNIAKMNGKRLNYCNEIRVSEFGHGADTFKTLVSGQAIDARGMWQEGFMARNIPLLMANANEMPITQDVSDGFLRRLIIIPFRQYISESERDPQLAIKLKRDLPGIFNWVMDGLKNLKNRKYNIDLPNSLRAEITELACDNSTTLRFMSNRGYQKRPTEPQIRGVPVQALTLYSRYKDWCFANAVDSDNIETPAKFGRKLKASGYTCQHMNGKVYYLLYSDSRGQQSLQELAYKPTPQKAVPMGKVNTGKPFFINGERHIRGIDNIATALGVKPRKIREFIANGSFDNMCFKRGNAMIFKVEPCEIVVREYQAAKYRREHTSKDKKKRIQADIAKFNSYCIRHNFPYRKSMTKTEADSTDDIIYVPLSFEISTREKIDAGAVRKSPWRKEVIYDEDGNKI